MTVHNVTVEQPADDGFGGLVIKVDGAHHGYTVRLSEAELEDTGIAYRNAVELSDVAKEELEHLRDESACENLSEAIELLLDETVRFEFDPDQINTDVSMTVVGGSDGESND